MPPINLGITSSFLDGGPLRSKPGWYLQHYLFRYSTHKFLNAQGMLLGGVPSPHFQNWSTAIQLFYQFEREIIFRGARPGFAISQPFVTYSRVDCNNLGISTSGTGFRDLVLSAYLQFDPITYRERPIFVHRVEFDLFLPTGKSNPKKTINPGTNFYYIDPYWAGTLYFTPNWSISWRWFYLWTAKDKETCVQSGTATHLNYSMEYRALHDLYVGINGYFLQQLKNDKRNGVEIPNTKQRVFAIGPGLLYLISHDFDFVVFFDLYFESHVRNRSQGISAVFRLLKYF